MTDPTILASAQTCSIYPDRVTGETKVFASQCKLRKGLAADVTMTRIELFEAPKS